MELTVTAEECVKILKVALKSQDIELINHKLVSNIPDGFNGLYFTLSINYKLNKKELKTLSCFLKSVPRNDRHFWYINGTKLLLKEYEMYQIIIPAIQKYIQDKIPVPDCYYIRFVKDDQFQNMAVMEDLKDRGFIMRNPREVMNYEECLHGVKALAKLHAGSIIYEQKERKPILELCKYPDEALWTTDPSNPAYPWRQSSIETLIEIAAKDDKFTSRLASIDSQRKLIAAYEDTIKLLRSSSKYSNVICHGDLWNNNTMFKYINNSVSEVILIDLQVYRYAPPITDVLMFIYLNTTLQFRNENKNKLLTEYSNTIKTIIESSGCMIPKELTLEGIFELEKEFKLFALVAATGYVPMCQLPPDARIKKSVEGITSEGARDFDVLFDFLNSRSEQVWRGMQLDVKFKARVEDALEELLIHIGL